VSLAPARIAHPLQRGRRCSRCTRQTRAATRSPFSSAARPCRAPQAYPPVRAPLLRAHANCLHCCTACRTRAQHREVLPFNCTPCHAGFAVTSRVDKAKCYTPADLRIGSVVSLRGRPMLLYACDDFTRRWYGDNMGFTAEELTDMDIREEARACLHHMRAGLHSTCFEDLQLACASFATHLASCACRGAACFLLHSFTMAALFGAPALRASRPTEGLTLRLVPCLDGSAPACRCPRCPSPRWRRGTASAHLRTASRTAAALCRSRRRRTCASSSTKTARARALLASVLHEPHSSARKPRLCSGRKRAQTASAHACAFCSLNARSQGTCWHPARCVLRHARLACAPHARACRALVRALALSLPSGSAHALQA
jgi:DUF1126 PH-like domain